MRIVIVTDSLVRNNGQGRVNYELALGLLERGHQVVAVSERVDEAVLAMGAKWIRIKPTFRRPALARVWDFARRADRAIAKFSGKDDVVIANGFTLRRPHDINAVHFVHGSRANLSVYSGEPGSAAIGWYREKFTQLNTGWEKQSFAAARLVVGVSGTVRDDLLQLGLPASKVKAVTNGVDLKEFSPGKVDRAALGLPLHETIALFVGDINTRRKNLDTVLRALVETPGLHLAVAASTGRSSLPAMADSLGVGSRVHFLGFRKDIPALMRGCDFFVFPSRYECCSLVLLEALASGLPVITAKTAACEVITPSCGVVLDDPNDHIGLATAMRRFASDPKLLVTLGQAARAEAEKHSWDRMVDRYVEIIESRPMVVTQANENAGSEPAELAYSNGR